jgi:Tfp pilus assembly protein PilF
MRKADRDLERLRAKRVGLAGYCLVLLLGLLAGCGRGPEPADAFMRQMNLGKTFYEGGEPAKAAEAFRSALRLQPTHPDAHINLANALLQAEQSESAVRQADEVLKLDPQMAAAYYVRGCARLRLRRFEEAVKDLQTAKQLDRTINAVSFQLGRGHYELGHFEDAVREFEEVVEFEPEHSAAHYNLSQALIRAGRGGEATQAIERHREITAKRQGPPVTETLLERCVYTQIRVPFVLDQPAGTGVRVVFTDVTAAAFGPLAATVGGPVGILDINRRGANDLLVLQEGAGFRVLWNSNGTFQAHGEPIPARPGARYSRCLVGDLNNDRYEDAVVLGDQGIHLLRFATNGAMSDATVFAGLRGTTATDGALVDLDFTGKLDLLLVAPEDGRVRVLRNLGPPYFKDISQTSGVPPSMTGARQLAIEDWNNDDLMDLVVVRPGQAPQMLVKQRGGALVSTNTGLAWPAAQAIALGDLNNDLRPDAVALGEGRLECVFNGLEERVVIPLGAAGVREVRVVDYDNDGWLDIAGYGTGLRLWRNRGRTGFVEVTAETGVDAMASMAIDALQVADFDGDGDSDFLLSAARGSGVRLLRNEGANANRQLKLRLFGNRSNASGLGVRVDLLAPGWRTTRTLTQLPLEIGVGTHARLDAITPRWLDATQPLPDTAVDPRSTLTLLEIVTQNVGSCPYVYAWDGTKFRFITDILGAAPLGLPAAANTLIEADPEELVWVGDAASFPATGGEHVLQITEELREVLYLDEAKLWVADYPLDVEVHPACKLVPGPPWPPKALVALHNRRPLLRALQFDGTDVSAALADVDGRLVSPARLRVPQLRGLAEPHGVMLDFGELDRTRPLVLALTGWLRFGGGAANVAASHDPELPFPFPMLEVELGSSGTWTNVDVVVGAPAGKTKTILVDLAGKLPPGSRRLRLSTAFEIHWDRVAMLERAGLEQVRVTTLEAHVADLHWRGFSEMASLPATMPLTPVYDQVYETARWRITPSGWCTRYGDVRELVGRKDNALALMNGGDELTLRFRAAQLPVLPPGQQRAFFLWSVGWDKDADPHVVRGTSVEPLPFHGMKDRRYGLEPRPASLDDAWITRYNTRWVGPLTLSRRGTPQQ